MRGVPAAGACIFILEKPSFHAALLGLAGRNVVLEEKFGVPQACPLCLPSSGAHRLRPGP